MNATIATLLELSMAFRFEQIFRDSFEADRIHTLAVIAFPMGSWVGGVYTTMCVRHLTLKGYKIALVTPGNDVKEILRIIPKVSPMYKQTVIMGYPPFLKTVVDAGRASGVKWEDYNIGMVFAGEVFSEDWRCLVAERASIHNPLTRMVSMYGTADAGVLACETPLSTRIRSWISKRPDLVKKLFGRERLPSLMQYDPCHRFVELRRDNGTIVFSTMPPVDGPGPAAGGDKEGAENEEMKGAIPKTPLIRYSIGDAGGNASYQLILNFVKEHTDGFDPVAETLASGARAVRKLPFVWVFGRAFWTVSLYGANVFVENIMVGLEQPDINQHVTGKFVLSVAEDENGDPVLSIIAELTPKQEPSSNLESQVAESIRKLLVLNNSEYGHYHH
ncbi:hypothetical protein HK102_001843 [Quaeritorhiza haematococci]|nr:hypothetical protein HK102_001843 [Quaeritorhiza haematococci]